MKRVKRKISSAEVRDVLDYDPEIGAFTWKVTTGKAIAGKRAGYVNPRGYVLISIAGASYLAHRLAWVYVHGEMPGDQIDHINGNPTDNRISNLRSVTASENNRNKRLADKNLTGVHGVRWDNKWGKWRSEIAIDGKWTLLGGFDNFEDAVAERVRAEKKYGYHDNHGRAA